MFLFELISPRFWCQGDGNNPRKSRGWRRQRWRFQRPGAKLPTNQWPAGGSVLHLFSSRSFRSTSGENASVMLNSRLTSSGVLSVQGEDTNRSDENAGVYGNPWWQGEHNFSKPVGVQTIVKTRAPLKGILFKEQPKILDLFKPVHGKRGGRSPEINADEIIFEP